MTFRSFLAATVSCMLVTSVPALGQVPQSSGQTYDGYVLGVNDEIEVTILNSSQAQTFKSRVKEDGTVTVPYIGAIQATGRTARQLSSDITRELKTRQIFANPIIGVEVAQFVSNSATIFGEVGTPGIYPLDRAMSVGGMMAKAGGARGNAADYLILRRNGEEHRILLNDLNGEWSNSTPLMQGDELFLPLAPMIYVYGQVQAAGSYSIKSNTTVRQALARAGGPTLAGSQKNISLYRGEEKLKHIDLNDPLQDGDVLYIHERLF